MLEFSSVKTFLPSEGARACRAKLTFGEDGKTKSAERKIEREREWDAMVSFHLSISSRVENTVALGLGKQKKSEKKEDRPEAKELRKEERERRRATKRRLSTSLRWTLSKKISRGGRKKEEVRPRPSVRQSGSPRRPRERN